MQMMKRHLAIFSPPAATQILEGKKTIESRFSKHRIAPFGQVEAGDIVLIKPVGHDLAGQFWVEKVIFFEGLDQSDWQLIKQNYGQQISFGSTKLDEKFFRDRAEARFGTIIFIGRVERFLTSPVKVEKKDKRGWVVLDQVG